MYLSGLLAARLSSGDEALTYKKNAYFWGSLMKYTCYAWLLSFDHSGIHSLIYSSENLIQFIKYMFLLVCFIFN